MRSAQPGAVQELNPARIVCVALLIYRLRGSGWVRATELCELGFMVHPGDMEPAHTPGVPERLLVFRAMAPRPTPSVGAPVRVPEDVRVLFEYALVPVRSQEEFWFWLRRDPGRLSVVERPVGLGRYSGCPLVPYFVPTVCYLPYRLAWVPRYDSGEVAVQRGYVSQPCPVAFQEPEWVPSSCGNSPAYTDIRETEFSLREWAAGAPNSEHRQEEPAEALSSQVTMSRTVLSGRQGVTGREYTLHESPSTQALEAAQGHDGPLSAADRA